MRVFISYSSLERNVAEVIAYRLKEESIPYWMAPECIPAGQSYTACIADAINGSDTILLVASRSAFSSPWVKKEIEYSIGKKKNILPFKIDNSEVPKDFSFTLCDRQWIYASEDIHEALQRLIKAINKQSENKPKQEQQPCPSDNSKKYSRSQFDAHETENYDTKSRLYKSISIDIPRYRISNDCVACGTCIDECPMDAISYIETARKYSIDPELCIDCGTCASVCSHKAIHKG